MSTMFKKCFICSKEISKSFYLTPEESSFMLKEILEISQWANELQRLMFEKVCYCGDCFKMIMKIFDSLKEIKKLEKELTRDKSYVRERLKKCEKKNINIHNQNQECQEPIGMLQKLRGEIVSELNSNTVESNLLKIGKVESNNLQLDHMINPTLSKNDTIENLELSQRKSIPPGSDDTSLDENDYSIVPVYSQLDLVEKNVIQERTTRQRLRRRTKSKTTHNNLKNNKNHSKSKTKILKMKLKKESKKLKSETKISSYTDSKYKQLPPRLQPKKCEECGKILGRKSSWKKHMTNIHLKTGNLELTSYTDKSKTQRGVEDQKTLENHFKCILCSKSFKSTNARNGHMNFHRSFPKCK